MHFRDVFGYGAEGRHGAEGLTLEVHVEPCHDDALARIGQLIADIHQTAIEKLCFINAHHIGL